MQGKIAAEQAKVKDSWNKMTVKKWSVKPHT